MPSAESRIVLPPVPDEIAARPVRVWREPVSIDTYDVGEPDRYPAYLDQRVYQGSSGAVYPMPFIDRVAQEKKPRSWDAIHLENDYVRLMILPELGGRIHVGLDRTRGYDFFYRNDVIKPALVGLLGPWISGGVEFNWPQHHRPATYLPTEALIEEAPDGSVTVWCSDHDPFRRMQGMHGIRLAPHSALVEVRGRLVNRTEDVQTFLWWANVAAAVNDDYQSFFPTDVTFVADHAKRAVTTFPAASDRYYGFDYPAQRTPERPDGDRLDWYRNIPVPTSYMCLGTQDDFFGGYDHGAGAGFVHWADHRIAPGKKMWTWGNAPFGWAWDAHLTDTSGPYVELMAGVFTDNQPDFAFLRPGETKSFSQYWYPIQEIGPVHQATRDAAVRLDVGADEQVRVGVAVTSPRPGARVVLRVADQVLLDERTDLAPGAPLVRHLPGAPGIAATAYELVVEHEGTVLVTWRPRPAESSEGALPDPATEPPAPDEIESVDELYVTGLHLEQYRHATRSPEPYWLEALRRDPHDARCATALAARRMHDGRLGDAERLLRTATARVTRRNPNPRDAEAHYRLGVVHARQGRPGEARNALATALWDRTWSDAAVVATVRLDLAAGRNAAAAEDLATLLSRAPFHVQARNLATIAALRSGNRDAARDLVRGTLAEDPLDAWARDLAILLDQDAEPLSDPTIMLDVALEYASVGETEHAIELLERVVDLPLVPGQRNVAPLALLHRADLELRHGEREAAESALERAARIRRTWCFPAASDNDMLERLGRAWPDNPLVAGLAGHWLYAAGRHKEAIGAWEASASGDTNDPVVLRNLGMAAYNVLGDAGRAAEYYAQARDVAPDDARLLYESDQLEGRRGTAPAARAAVLLERPDLVASRDDLSVQLAELLIALGRPEDALGILTGRSFQPWEGGEGRVLDAWDEAHLALARRALAEGATERALEHVCAALSPATSLGEARHPLANTADLHLLLGDALRAVGRPEEANAAWSTAAGQQGDFQSMEVQTFSERTAASVTALRRLGRDDDARRLQDDLARYVAEQGGRVATIDYFATSLPTLLLFTQDVQDAHDTRAVVLRAQLAALDGDLETAAALARQVLDKDALNAPARTLLVPAAT
jgi:tetratricopeptide (TPR) repeat protein